jgi:hypothetical protein
VILHWLKSTLVVVVLEGATGVIAVQKMVTEDYRPWYGDSLSSLAIVRESNSIGVRIVDDSPEVRSALSRYALLQRSSSPTNQGTVMPDPNQELVRDLEAYPHFEVKAGTHCKILERFEVRCRGNTYTSTFVKVRITSGTYRRKEGLVCDAEIARTVSLP